MDNTQQSFQAGQKMAQSQQGLSSSTGFNEAITEDGQVRPHWQYLFDSLEQLGAEAVDDRQKKAQRILRDDGASYNVYQDSKNKSRVWRLDPIPHVVRSEEWAEIESGLVERSEILNLLLKDIYGDREIVKYGIVPPEVVYSHQGFLRACQGLQLSGDHQLILHAVDMVRDENGIMQVIGDRTQAPSGAGYALENRMVMSRIFPSLFRDSHVHRLALFFRALRSKLFDLSLSSELPRVVILTPGAFNETFFEHAYLANYLGFTLVQGGDLTVRDGYVWLKSLEGLRKVDVILRRVDDSYCDPVELMDNSHLGVPGLLEVVRAGRVVVANPLGSGIVESPAFLKYFNQMSKFYLGREPRLKTVDTYWCGNKEDRGFVLNNLDSLIIKPTDRSSGNVSLIGSELTADALNQLKLAIQQNPYHFVAQRYIRPSQTPAWNNQKTVNRPVILRAFSVAHETSYSVMPGGLTRIGASSEAKILTNQLGSESKDTWVIASEPEKLLSLQPSTKDTTSIQDEYSTDLPSRVVENLFWLGRYAERAESALRLLRSVFIRLNGVEYLSEKATRVLLSSITHLTNTYPGFVGEKSTAFDNVEGELLSLVLDDNRPGSVSACLLSMLNCAEQVKELLSADTQRVVNDIGDELAVLKTSLQAQMGAAPEEALDPLVTALMALSGLFEESMIRGIGWRFMEIGRRLERSLQTISLSRSTLVPVMQEPDEMALLESLLLTTEGLITYRRRYRTDMNVANAVHLILLDESNPRSLIYQLRKLEKHFSVLPKVEAFKRLSAKEKLILEVKTRLQLSEPESLAAFESGSGIRTDLETLLKMVHDRLLNSATSVTGAYFEHADGPQLLVPTGWKKS